MITIPSSLEAAIELLIDDNVNELGSIMEMSESDFVTMSHHGIGRNIRNDWKLWNRSIADRTDLVKYFNSLGIHHADDMSGIILTSFYRSINSKDLDVIGQVEEYKKFWAEQGFPDGVYAPRN